MDVEFARVGLLVAKRDERGERGEGGDDVVPRISGPAKTIAGRAGRGVTEAARGYDQLFARVRPAVRGSQFESAVRAFQPVHFRLRLDLHALRIAQAHERIHHIRSVVGFGISAVASLHDRRHAVGREKIDNSLRSKIVERGLYEVGLGLDVRAELIPVFEVGEIAAAFARDHDLTGGARHLLEKSH